MTTSYYKQLRRQIGKSLLLVLGVAALVHDSSGRLLLQRKSDGYWSLPAGAIEPGETPEEAMRRELLEETGLYAQRFTLICCFGGNAFRYTYPDGNGVEYVVLMCPLAAYEVGGDGRGNLLTSLAAKAWRRLKAAALIDGGVDLIIVSAFRSIDRQAEIIRRKLEPGDVVENILTICAPPGFSEYHTGQAVDLSTPNSRALEVEFDQTAAYAWLTKHAAEFGYYLSFPIGNSLGYQYEPWHWCFIDANPSERTPQPNICHV